MTTRWFIPLGCFAALAVLLGVGLRLNPREVPTPFIGKPAPDFKLPTLTDPAVTLSAADLRGKVWVLNVWASWCAPCREEHPVLVALAREQAVPIYGLNYKDDPRNAQEWLRQLGDPYARSVSDLDGRVGIDYGVYGVPETFVIDRDGLVRLKHVGPLTREVWAKDIQPLLLQLAG